MRYCSQCGNPVIEKVPEGDNRKRFVCLGCGCIHYSNPNIITGCLVVSGRRVLLCRRATSPQKGLWTLPAGFLENNETTAEGAVRETWEEACAKVAIHGIYALYDLPHISQLYIIYRARLIGRNFACGTESAEVRLFEERRVPWEELAFPIVGNTLRNYFRDRKRNVYPVHTQTYLDRIEDE